MQKRLRKFELTATEGGEGRRKSGDEDESDEEGFVGRGRWG